MKSDRNPISRQSKSVARDRLIAAGIQLFADPGVEAVNSNQLARKAGVGVGTFYSHFKDKWELHQEIVLSIFEALSAGSAQRAREREGMGIDLQVRGQIEVAVEFARRNPDCFRLAFGGSAARSGGRGRPAAGYSSRAVELRLLSLQRSGDLDPKIDPGVAARGFIAMQSGAILGWLRDPKSVGREQLIDTLTRLHPAVAGRPSPGRRLAATRSPSPGVPG